MKKFTLFFTGLIFSLSFFNFKTYAQEELPISLFKINYTTYTFEQENSLTYEYLVYYYTSWSIYESIDENDYFLVNTSDIDNVNLTKGLNRFLNSYELEEKHVYTEGTSLILRITVNKSFVDGGYLGGNVESLFKTYLHLYVYFSEGGNPEYDRGYDEGYDEGYDVGYDIGYEEGDEAGYDRGVLVSQSEAYQDGYNKGAEEAFIAKMHIWIVPAMILVIVTGIFVGYRRKDD